MVELDEQEVKITRELIKNPRSSDNSISKATGIPVMSVNRKRKKLEEKNIISYFACVKSFESGLNIFHARQLYIIQLRSGITRESYLKYLKESVEAKTANSHHIEESYIGEQNGRLALIILLEAGTEAELVEIFNGLIISSIKKSFGQNSITSIETARINMRTRLFHNYLPHLNMDKGKIKKDWPDDFIFVNKPKNTEINRKIIKEDDEKEKEE